MSNYNLILETFKGNKSRHTCPGCGKRFEFARYINTDTGEYIADHVGRCNREVNCGYHYTPKQYFQDNPVQKYGSYSAPQYRPKETISKPELPMSYLPIDLFERSLVQYGKNNFYLFLRSLFSEPVAMNLVKHYCMGTSIHWPGSNVFWQVDYHGNIRQAKIMLYEPNSGRRIKDQGDKVFFAGKKLLNNYNANLLQCFFGEVLLSMSDNKVAIVESEKTAMIASVYFPDLIWLATGGSHGCRWTQKEVCSVLNGREVILFPDLGFYGKWKEKADQVQKLVSCKIIVSDLLEQNASDDQRMQGLDLADYLLMNRDSLGWAMTTEGYPLIWDLKTPVTSKIQYNGNSNN